MEPPPQESDPRSKVGPGVNLRVLRATAFRGSSYPEAPQASWSLKRKELLAHGDWEDTEKPTWRGTVTPLPESANVWVPDSQSLSVRIGHVTCRPHCAALFSP